MRTINQYLSTDWFPVSGGEFYDPTNGSNLGGPGSVQGSLHNLPESEGSGEGAPADTIVPPKGFVRPEINFIAKLRQRQRQRALVPAVAIAVGQHQTVPVEVADPNSDYPDVDLATLGEDLEMVVRFLDQHWVELFGGGGEEPAGDQPQQMQPGQKRAAALRTSMSRRSNSFNMPKERFSPSISVGEFYGTIPREAPQLINFWHAATRIVLNASFLAFLLIFDLFVFFHSKLHEIEFCTNLS